MNHCPRCRAVCVGDAYCSWCGLPTAGPAPTLSARRAVPGAVLTVQILLGLGVAFNVLLALLIMSLYSMTSTIVAEMGPVTTDPFLDAQFSYLYGYGIFAGVMMLTAAAVSVWAIVAVNRASRAARVVVTAMHPTSALLVGLSLGADPALAGAGAGGVLILLMLLYCLPGLALFLILLWAVPSSRLFFDHGRAPAYPPTAYASPMPPVPYPRPPGRGPRPMTGPPPDDATPTGALVVPRHVLPPARSGAPE